LQSFHIFVVVVPEEVGDVVRRADWLDVLEET